MKANLLKRYRRRGVRERVAAAASIVLAVTLLIGAIVLVALVDSSLQNNLDTAAVTRAEDVSAAITANGMKSTIPSSGDDGSLVQIINSAGIVVSSTENFAGERALLNIPPRQRQTTLLTIDNAPIGDGSDTVRVAAEPIQLPSGPGWVYVANSLAQLHSATKSLVLLLGIGLPILLIIVVGTVWFAVGRALRPVEQIRRRTIQIRGDFTQRVPVPPSDDEIGRLARTVNDMLDRLAAAADQERRFVGDASHELRSPLAAIRAQIDVALEHPESEDPQRVFQTIQTQTEDMTQLLEDLLFLARVSEDQTNYAAPDVDLDEVLVQEVRRLHHAHRVKQNTAVTVRISHLDAVRMPGSARDLARMIANLLNNAADFAKTEVTVELHVVETENIYITVTDDGPGIAKTDRERIFDRFTRLDDSRSRATAHTSTGLGLAIAQQIANRHAGTIVASARTDTQPGAVITISLPYPAKSAR
ncbi:HAMP domain-containing sensor histidine kinase [Frigoribacterium sp. CG_9.8]|uniref:sensor histidine kinase n=1 Tax=Frigoribacterium sp. CG_9.8 TaxID=2787733 RepID=UPI0018CAB7DD|nr:HAMP domain-containing sensor histidine kinase [Frigoribacterium sp. CG_9.8]MBG6108630.1 signal transduction histidine kinase [Frigoribacterium sp. CG_9.8]